MRVLPQTVDAREVGACFGPLQACPLAAGAKPDPHFHVFLVATTDPDGVVTNRSVCSVDVRGRPPRVTSADIEQWLIRQIPPGSVGTPNAKSLVNLKTIFWLNSKSTYQWGPVTVIQPGVRIRVRLDHVQWDFGDGESDSAASTGRPYDPASPCDLRCDAYYGHPYTAQKGLMTVTARSYWFADFSVNGSAWVTLANPVPANPARPAQVTIVQARSQLVAPKG